MASRTLEVKITGDTKDLDRALRRTGATVGQTDSKLRRLGQAAKVAGAALATAAGVAIKESVEAASNLEESINKANETFEKSAPIIKRWSKEAASSMGLARAEALEGAASIGAMLKPMGVAPKRAAEMSKRMTELAADMASFNNEDPTEMLDRIRSGLSGESEPLKRYGAVLSETRVAQHAWKVGIAEAGEELSEQQKIMGRYSLLLRDTKDQQGDFGRTSDSLANQQRILKAEFTDLGAKLGKVFIPAAKSAAQALNFLLTDGPSHAKQAFADVKRFFSTNEDAKAFAKVVGALADAVRFAFREVIVPVVRRAWGGVKQILSSFVEGVRGLTRIVLGLLTGDFARAWEGVKGIVRGALDAAIGIIRILTAPVREAMSRFARAIAAPVSKVFRGLLGVVRAVFDKMLGIVSTALNTAADAIENTAGRVPVLGDKFDGLADDARGAANKIDGFRDSLKDADKSGRKSADNLSRSFGKAVVGVGRNMGSLGKIVKIGLDTIRDNTNAALKAFGVKVLNFTLKNPKKAGNIVGSIAGAFRSGGAIPVPGTGTGDIVPAMLEPGEVVINRRAVQAMGGPDFVNEINDVIPRFATGGIAGLQPGISRLVRFAANRFGLRVSSGLRPGDAGSFHASGQAADLVPPSMGATQGIFSAFRPQLEELFYDPWGGWDSGQRIGAIGGHMDHIHAAILGSGRGGPMGRLPRVLLQGPKGPLRGLGQAALDRTHRGAQSYLRRHTRTSHGNVGIPRGPLQGIARRMVSSRWGPGQWPPFNELVMRESGWDPTAVNPTSGAAGLAQALPPSKYPPGAWPYTGRASAVKQLQWMVGYIGGRYGTPSGALAFHNANNWYRRGGVVGLRRGTRRRKGKGRKGVPSIQTPGPFGVWAPGKPPAFPMPGTGAFEKLPVPQQLTVLDILFTQAEGTEDTADDIAVLGQILDVQEAKEKRIRRKLRKPGLSKEKRGRLLENLAAITGDISGTTGQIASLRETGTEETEVGLDDLKRSIDELTATMERQNNIAQSEIAVGLTEARRALADLISGQIGSNTYRRGQTAGAGAAVRY